MKNKHIFFLVVLSFFVNLTISAQSNTKSFYSSKGFGEREFFGNNYTRSLGHVSNGIRSQNQVSFSNPASVSALKNVHFDFGFRADAGSIFNEKSKFQYYNGNFNYLSFAFPIIKKDTTTYSKNKSNNKSIDVDKKVIWAAHIGIIPHSNIGNSYYKETDTSFGKFFNIYSHNGGLTNLFIQNAVNITNNLSFGFTTSYLFGQSKYNFISYFNDSGIGRLIDDEKLDYQKGFNFQFGIQGSAKQNLKKYKIDSIGNKTLIKTNVVNFVYGGTYGNLGSLNSNGSRVVSSVNTLGTSIKDTVFSIFNNKRSLKLNPILSLGFSATYNNLWMIAFDYYTETALNYDKNYFIGDSFNKYSQFSFGLAYRPDVPLENMKRRAGKKIVPNFEYRLGLRMANTGLNVLNNRGEIVPIKEIGISFGLGIPKPIQTFYNKSMKSMFNISYEYIFRGSPENGLVADRLNRLTLSFYLNDIWFVKRKFY